LSNLSSDVRKCSVSDPCQGGSDPTQQCKYGYSGPYCSVCSSGFVKSYGGQCVSCRGGDELAVILPSFLLAFLIFMLVNRRRVRAFINKMLERAIKNVAKYQLVGWATKLKILIGFYQIIMQMGSVLGLFFPNIFLDFLNVFNFFLFDISALFFQFGCVYGVNYYSTLWASTVFPLALIGAIFVVLRLRHELSKRFNERSHYFTIEKFRYQFIYCVIVVAFVFFSPTSTVRICCTT